MIYRRGLITGSLSASVIAPFVLRASRSQAQAIAKGARMLVGFPPGGAPDVAGRLLAEKMKDYAPSMVIENHPGAGGRLALEALKKAEPDGSVLALSPGDQLALFPHIYRTLTYDPLRDFTPVTTVCTVPFVFVVGPLVPTHVRTLAQFIDWCRANPRLASYGSAGVGTLPHLIGASLGRTAGFEFVHSPYKGGVQAAQDLLAGQLAAAVFTVAAVLPHVASGRLRPLAVTSARRSPLLPDVPTIAEAGYPTLETVVWLGVLVPVATPPGIVAVLNAAVRRALETEAVRTGLAKQALDPAGSSAPEFATLLKADTARWGELVKETGFSPLD
jgi:tripartite-type tricarboxylate transporter receptor subunit TctC